MRRGQLAPLVALLGLLTACRGGRTVPIRVLGLPEKQDSDERLIAEAFAILDLDYEHSVRSRGTIHISLIDLNFEVDAPGTSVGQTLLERRCSKALVAQRDPIYVAHEVGHVLGLGHVCESSDCGPEDDGNLMHGGNAAGTELTEGQFDDLDKGSRKLNRCR